IHDIIGVCDPNKTKQNRLLGAPDLVVEIISPSSAKIDRMDNRLAYQWSGVRDYWIIEPANQIIEAYLLKGHAVLLDNVYNRKDFVLVLVLENHTINTALIFPERTENYSNVWKFYSLRWPSA